MILAIKDDYRPAASMHADNRRPEDSRRMAEFPSQVLGIALRCTVRPVRKRRINNQEQQMSAANTLVIKRTFPASGERVFSMWTTEELMKQWFCPGKDMTSPVDEVDASEGGSYRIVMQGKDGETCSTSGVYEKVVPNEKLVFS